MLGSAFYASHSKDYQGTVSFLSYPKRTIFSVWPKCENLSVLLPFVHICFTSSLSQLPPYHQKMWQYSVDALTVNVPV